MIELYALQSVYPMLENQMEKNMEHGIETTMYSVG